MMTTNVGSADRQDILKRALLEIKELRAQLAEKDRAASEPIAVVGMSCRFPGGADSPERYWSLVRGAVDAISEVPPERWDSRAYYDPDLTAPGKMYVREGGFLADVDRFDPQFFGLSPREANSMDPQQRVLMEVAWEALEHAAIAPERLRGSQTGVFIGIIGNEYFQMLLQGDPTRLDPFSTVGNLASVASGRLSYFLGTHGPSLSVDTACSSSLVTVHLAMTSLRSGECDLALAGGVTLTLSPVANIALCKMQALAADGRCKTFDARGEGYGRGEGCGVVVLRRLSDAIAHGDRVLALLSGSAVNQDGPSSGLTVPNGPAQQAVIRRALANARVAPAEVDYLEAHGTGTSLGDPIEVQALGAVLGQDRPADRPLLLGSVKANIGHLEAAAGVAGLIKIVLALQHGEVPPQPAIQILNPRLALDRIPARIPSEPVAWPAERRRIAGISSFGFSGTNVHVVVEGAPAPAAAAPATTPDRPLHVLPLSAHSPTALRELAGRYAELLDGGDHELGDVCFTAATGRSHFAHRAAIVAPTPAALRTFAAGGTAPGAVAGAVARDARPRIAFLFTGQGAQYPGMGRALYDAHPVVREALDRCAELLRPVLERPLLDVMFDAAPGGESPLDQTAYTQPALFALEYALAELYRSWGIAPVAVLGHSVGEYAAACVADVLDFEQGLALIAERGRLMQALPDGGAMAAVTADESRVARALAPFAGEVAIAAINGPDDVVISGARAAVEQVVTALARDGVRAKYLPVSHAFHSPLMDPVLDAFERRAASLRFAAPRIRLVSNVTGGVARGELLAQPSYWRRHLREPVQFAAGMRTLGELGCTALIEIGPGGLLALAQRNLDDDRLWVSTLRRGRDEWEQVLLGLGALYVRGVDIDWAAFDRPYQRRKVVAPSYPFQRQRCWFDGAARAAPAALPAAPSIDDLLYEIAWRPASSAAASAPGALDASGTWLIFTDDGGTGAALARQIGDRGGAPVLIRRAAGFAAEGATRFGIDPGAPGDAHRLIAAIASEVVTGARPTVRAVVHLWGLDAPGADDALSLDALHAAQDLGCHSALAVIQALVAHGVEARWWLATRGAQPAGAPSALAVAQAPLWGLGRCIASEHPALWGGMIDLDPARRDAAAEASALLAELVAPDGEDHVALRADARLVARLARVAAARPSSPPALTSDATYLITGGAGGLGLEVARWLIERGARHLVLTGRRALDDARRAALRALEAGGGSVRYVQADVCDPRAMTALFTELRGAPRPLRGIVYAAGIADPGPLVEQDRARFDAVLAPKLGAWRVHELSRELPLDFLVLFSSISAVWGSIRLGSYAAANHFLDALAHHRRALGLPALSIAWGAWSEVGMSASEAEQAYLTRMGVRGLATRPALAALGQLIARGAVHCTVAPVDWDQFKAIYEARARRPLLDGVTPAPAGEAAVAAATPPAPAADLMRAFEQAGATGRAALIERYLGEQLARAMLVDPAGLDLGQPILSLGVDSLMVMDVISACKRDTGLRLYPREFFERPSGRDVASYIADELEAKLGLAGHAAAAVGSAPGAAPRTGAPGASGAPGSAPVRRRPRPARRNPPMAFLLSSPRTGSTLLRVMLAGHSRLFCPPELHLLPYFSMQDRERALAGSHLDEGLERAMMELVRGQDVSARELTAGYLADDLPVQEVYRRLQALAAPRLVVDKSPSYAGNLETLERAEAIFARPRYIHLVRHPFAVLESVVRNRLDRALGVSGMTPLDFGEQTYATANANLLDFGRRVDPARYHLVRYEELVRDPARVMAALCAFLDVPFEDAVLEPYRGERMTDGIHAKSMSIGDPNFHQHDRIDEALGDVWRTIRLPRRLGPLARRVSAELGYELPHQDDFLPPGVLTPAELAHHVAPAAELPAPAAGGAVVAVDAAEPVLLTGATGFVGAYLLDALLRRTASPVYCLVRCRDAADGRARIRAGLDAHGLPSDHAADRIRVVPGDLAQPGLGLGDAGFAELAAGVGAVYHNAAMVNFVYPLELLKAANVGGTREIMRLCTTGRTLPLHYISTYGVWGIGGAGADRVTEDESIDHGRYLINGYVQSKWIAERELMAARARGLPVNLFRLGRITGHSRTGDCESGSFTTRLIKGCAQLGKSPELSLTMDMTPVDYAVDAVVALARRATPGNWHIMNPTPVPFGNVVAVMRRIGYRLDPVPADVWLEALFRTADTGSENALHPILAHLENIVCLSGERALEYDCSNVEGALAGELACPVTDDAMLERYLAFFIRSGVLSAPAPREPA
jgi:thioester reductase-like protein